MIQITEHFTWEDFACEDGTPVPTALRPNTIRLCRELEALWHSVGRRDIIITSGYRTLTWNTRVGGAKESQHLAAKAADFYIVGLKSSEAWCAVDAHIKRGAMRDGGLGYYGELADNHIHYDTGPPRRWNNSGGPDPVCHPIQPVKEEEDMKYISATINGQYRRYITDGLTKRWVTVVEEDAMWVSILGNPISVAPKAAEAIPG